MTENPHVASGSPAASAMAQTRQLHPVPNPAASEEDSLQLAHTIAQAIEDRKGGDIVLLNMADVSYLADYFVIATGFSNVQVRAIARSIEDAVEEQWQRSPVRASGQTDGRWVLMDYGEVVVHLFLPEERDFYGLESFWAHAERIPFAASA
jgi:ribosome-associated protein